MRNRMHICIIGTLVIVMATAFFVPHVSRAVGTDQSGIILKDHTTVADHSREIREKVKELGNTVSSFTFWLNPMNWIPGALQIIVTVLTILLGAITGIAVGLLDIVMSINKFSTNDIVKNGWEFVRDALNFMFILAILIIAFATIAGIEGWNMKALLPRLLIAALLVNFSLAIGGVFIDFSRVLMHTFAGEGAAARGDAADLATRLMNSSAIQNYYKFNAEQWLTIWPGGPEENQMGAQDWGALAAILGTDAWATLFGKILALILILLITAALVVSAIFLMVRAIALWVLLILSPVGFVFMILPRTQGIAAKWWETFIKYVMFGPVFVFFLALAAQIGGAVAGRDGRPNSQGLKGFLYLDGSAPGSVDTQGTLTNFLFERPLGFSILQTLLVVIFIFAGLLAAQAMGVYGGRNAARWTLGLAGAGGRGMVGGTLGASRLAQRIPYAGKILGAPATAYDATRGAYYGWKSGREMVDTERQLGGKRFGERMAVRGKSEDMQQRVMQRQARDIAKDMGEKGIGRNEAIDTIRNPAKPMVERRAAALRALELDALDKPDEYRAAIGVLRPGTKEHADAQRKYRRAHPILDRANITERELGNKEQTSAAFKRITPAVRQDIVDDVRKAGDEAKNWNKDTIDRLTENNIPLGSANIRTIMRYGTPDAKAALKRAHTGGKLTDEQGTMYTSEGGK